MNVLGVIPARGGSKGIPRKNIVPLCGKPMIAYTIEAANKASRLVRTIVSTDDQEIADLSKSLGGDVPFLRPIDLSGDAAATLPVLSHALEELEGSFDAVMVLQPTSPMRTAEDIDRVIEMLENDPSADSVISVVKVGDHHPARMKFIENGCLVDPPYAESLEGQRRQDLPDLYLRNGAIYLTRAEVILEKSSLKGEKSLAYVMPEGVSINIDHPFDLVVAEAMMTQGGGE